MIKSIKGNKKYLHLWYLICPLRPKNRLIVFVTYWSISDCQTNDFDKLNRVMINQTHDFILTVMYAYYGLLARYVKLRFAHASGMPGTFSPPPGVSDPDMHHGTCVTHVPWCMSGSLTSGFLWSRWRGERSRHSRRMRNPQNNASCKRPMKCKKAGIGCLHDRCISAMQQWYIPVFLPVWCFSIFYDE